MLQTITIGAGQRVQFSEVADFFRILTSTGAVTVTFYKQGAALVDAAGVQAGYSEQFGGGGFDRFEIYAAGSVTIQFVARLGNVVSYDGSVSLVGGSIAISNTSGAFSSAQATVTNTSGQLLAANAARRFVLIQNNDTSGIVYVNLAGATATAANSLKIAPGGSVMLDAYCPSGAITAFGSIASNANVVVIEG